MASNEKVPLLNEEDGHRNPSSKRTKLSRTLIASCVCCSLTGLAAGIDFGVMADAVVFIKDEWNLTPTQEERCLGIIAFISAFGALFGLKTADRFGRKPTMVLCTTTLFVGTVIQALATFYTMLMIGRVIAGIGVGIYFVVSPMYISEISPPSVRGTMGALFEISINTGISLGYLIGYLCGAYMTGPVAWRTMIGVSALPPIVVLFTLYFLPESPRWLVSQGLNNSALVVLDLIGEEDAEKTLSSIIQEETEARKGGETSLLTLFGWKDQTITTKQSHENLAHSSVVRKAVILAGLLGFFQQFGGSEALLYYTPTFLENAGMKSAVKQTAGEISIGVGKLIANVVMSFYIDSIGRRPLLIGSSIGVTLSLVALCLITAFNGNPIWIIVFVSIYMTAFGCGLGLVTWLSATEILPNHVRTQGMVLVTFVNRLTAGIISSTTLSLITWFGFTGFLVFYLILSIICTIFYVYMVPETANRSLEEIAAELRSKKSIFDIRSGSSGRAAATTTRKSTSSDDGRNHNRHSDYTLKL